MSSPVLRMAGPRWFWIRSLASSALSPRPGISAGDVQRLVVGRDVVDRNPFVRVRLDELREVVGERLVGVGSEMATDHVVAGLHPPGRAPRRCHDAQLRVESQRLFEDGDDVRAVVVDRELRQRRVGLARGHVVVGVVALDGEVAGAHGLPDEAQSDAVSGAEQVAHRGVPALLVEPGADEPRRGVGEGGAITLHLLVLTRLVDGDRRPGGSPAAGPVDGRLGGEIGLVGRRTQPGLDPVRRAAHRFRTSRRPVERLSGLARGRGGSRRRGERGSHQGDTTRQTSQPSRHSPSICSPHRVRPTVSSYAHGAPTRESPGRKLGVRAERVNPRRTARPDRPVFAACDPVCPEDGYPLTRQQRAAPVRRSPVR